MNWSHLRATIWMRWRILVNRIRRTGKLGNTLLALVVGLALIVAIGLFVFAYRLGIHELPEANPMGVLATWLGLSLGFAFFWMVGLVTDLQRADAMSFRNLLHLPISLRWAFLYNYLSSYVSLSVGLFLPAMLGLACAMVATRGPAALLAFPLILAFFALITALTYQLRGWLARLMENKRRGRNVIALVTVAFVVLLQLPNLINLALVKNRRAERDAERSLRREERALEERDRDIEAALDEIRGTDVDGIDQGGTDQAVTGQGVTGAEKREAAEAQKRERLSQRRAESARSDARAEQLLLLCTKWIPLGWLAFGMRAAFEGRLAPPLLGLLGMAAIAAWSLRRSYRTTMASILGQEPERARSARGPAAKARASDGRGRRPLLVERSLPFVDDPANGIAWASLRSTLRAPEAKIMFLSPVILLSLFAIMLGNNPRLQTLQSFGPMMALGAISMGLFSISQLIQNQFGLDRDGFRLFVLSPVPRHQILLGKNLATAPLGLGIGLLALLGLQFFVPLDLVHFAGACLQLVSAYMLCCLVGNMLSILGPMRLKPHGMRAEGVKWKTVLWQLLSVILLPIAFSPLLIPLGIEFLLRHRSWATWLPLYPLLHGLLLILVYQLYRWLSRLEGELLQRREQRILAVLTRE